MRSSLPIMVALVLLAWVTSSVGAPETASAPVAGDADPNESALYFDGVSGLGFSPKPIFDLTEGTIDFTMVVLVRPTVLDYGPCIVACGWSQEETRYCINLTSGLDGIGLWNGKTWGEVNFLFEPRTWYHVAFVTQDDMTDVYVDGDWIGLISVGYGETTEAPLSVGASAEGDDGYVGGLADLRLWDRALADEQVRVIAGQRGPVTDPTLGQHLVGFLDLADEEMAFRVVARASEEFDPEVGVQKEETK